LHVLRKWKPEEERAKVLGQEFKKPSVGRREELTYKRPIKYAVERR
jgi:hypothetical protein